jgi:hypothetical protein
MQAQRDPWMPEILTAQPLLAGWSPHTKHTPRRRYFYPRGMPCEHGVSILQALGSFPSPPLATGAGPPRKPRRNRHLTAHLHGTIRAGPNYCPVLRIGERVT